ncbi:MAG: hypothetical protein WC686_05075 [Candidatus Shapirobacteria bacterium]|jgi:hypothetical protein
MATIEYDGQMIEVPSCMEPTEGDAGPVCRRPVWCRARCQWAAAELNPDAPVHARVSVWKPPTRDTRMPGKRIGRRRI